MPLTEPALHNCTGKFLEAVRASIAADFHELRAMSADSLLYIKVGSTACTLRAN